MFIPQPGTYQEIWKPPHSPSSLPSDSEEWVWGFGFRVAAGGGDHNWFCRVSGCGASPLKQLFAWVALLQKKDGSSQLQAPANPKSQTSQPMINP